ncbi:unnamed protein product [Camellia sinensis]
MAKRARWWPRQDIEGRVSSVEEVVGVKNLLQHEKLLRKSAEKEVNNLRNQLLQWKRTEAAGNSEISKLHKLLEDEVHQKRKLEEEIAVLQSQLLQLSFEADEVGAGWIRSARG